MGILFHTFSFFRKCTFKHLAHFPILSQHSTYFIKISCKERFYVDITCEIWNNLYRERAKDHAIDDEIDMENAIGQKK